MINGFDCTDKEPPSDFYEGVTWAFDLYDSDDKAAVLRELKRLKRKGEKLVVYYYDTRKTGKRTRVSVDKVTRKGSVFAEIWRERETDTTQACKH